MHRIALLLIALFGAHVSFAGPRAGLIDPTFGDEGVSTHGFDIVPNGADAASAFAEDDQGRFYLVGTLKNGANSRCMGVARFSPEGIVDEAYGTGGTACVPLDPDAFAGLETVSDAVMRGDGTLLVSGSLPGAPLRPFVCHFTADGHLDAAFSAGNTPGCLILSVEEGNLDVNGKYDNDVMLASIGLDAVMVLNSFQEEDGLYLPKVLQFDGTAQIFPLNGTALAPAAFTPPFPSVAISAIAFSSSGKLLLAGAAHVGPGENYAPIVASLDVEAAKMDLTFNGSGYFVGPPNTGAPKALALDASDAIVVAGHKSKSGKLLPTFFKLTSAGMPDMSFNDGKMRTYDPCGFMLDGCEMFPKAIGISRSGKILFAGSGSFGSQSTSDMWVFRLEPNGNPDQEFGSPILTQDGFARVDTSPADVAVGLSLQGEQAVLAGWRRATDQDIDFALVRLADGSVFRDGLE